MPYKLTQTGGEITLEFAGVVKLHIHLPDDETSRQQVMGMIAAAPNQADPYAMMASISHEPVASLGTQTLHAPS